MQSEIESVVKYEAIKTTEERTQALLNLVIVVVDAGDVLGIIQQQRNLF